MMECRTVRERLVEYAAGRLEASQRVAVARHIERCPACGHAAAVEGELTFALQRVPRYRAPDGLRRRLEALVGATSALSAEVVAASPRRGGSRLSDWMAPFVSACAAAALVLVVVRTTAPRPPLDGSADLLAEAVNDHLRVVSSSHPVEIESGGIHQVKPWFTGRLEFGPRVAFSGDGDFPLVGGSVGYFRDRKAAVFEFTRRLHAFTLLVLPPGGLVWPTEGPIHLGRLSVAEEESRGFSVLFWRDGGLGYALVSDVSKGDLELLASRINPE
jgi:anti-sigma factor RsiW